MPRGGPDYGNPDYTFFTVETPTSDIVSTLQGFSRLDNRGRVLWFEDWQSNIYKWGADYDSDKSQVVNTLSLGLGIGNNGVVKLDPLTALGFAGLNSVMMLPVSKRLGVELSFYTEANAGELLVTIEHNFSGSKRKSGVLQIKEQTGVMKVQTPGGYQTVYTPTNYSYLVARFISVKIVIDIEAGKYSRLMIGNSEIDLSANTLVTSVDGLVGDTFLNIYSNGVSATYRRPYYLAYIIISGDEP